MLPPFPDALAPTAAAPLLRPHACAPERVLQFGTGAFLRGFAEDFVDEANRDGLPAGLVVMVGSTGSERAGVLAAQEGCYTLLVRGLRGGEPVDEARTLRVVSRALSADRDWDAVLALARSPELRLVVSNTTEVGLALDPADRPGPGAPASFPAKLTAVLAERARALGDVPEADLIVLPCELVEDNGARLEALVRTLAARWHLGPRFEAWLDARVTFCNTLVDRIVPGAPDDADAVAARLGYRDALVTVAEPYRLWAIEGDAALAARLPLAGPGLVVTRSVAPYRERKVRVLNGGHTLMVPVGLLAGLGSVREVVSDNVVSAFVQRAVMDEIVPGLGNDPAEAAAFARDVLDRFANPFVRHELRAIALQQTAKLSVRVVPSAEAYAARTGRVPRLLAFGVAAFVAATAPGALALPEDDAAPFWAERWAALPSPGAAGGTALEPVPADALHAWFAATLAAAWEGRLATLPGFAAAAADAFLAIRRDGLRPALARALA